MIHSSTFKIRHFEDNDVSNWGTGTWDVPCSQQSAWCQKGLYEEAASHADRSAHVHHDKHTCFVYVLLVLWLSSSWNHLQELYLLLQTSLCCRFVTVLQYNCFVFFLKDVVLDVFLPFFRWMTWKWHIRIWRPWSPSVAGPSTPPRAPTLRAPPACDAWTAAGRSTFSRTWWAPRQTDRCPARRKGLGNVCARMC